MKSLRFLILSTPHAETLQQMKDTTVKTFNTVKEEVVDKTKKAASVVKEKAEKLNENEDIRKTLDILRRMRQRLMIQR